MAGVPRSGEAEIERRLAAVSEPELDRLPTDQLADAVLERNRDVLDADTSALLVVDPSRTHLLEHGDGHIVNTASMAGHHPGHSAYTASKWAVVAITEGLYHQLRSEGSTVGVSCLCPGWWPAIEAVLTMCPSPCSSRCGRNAR